MNDLKNGEANRNRKNHVIAWKKFAYFIDGQSRSEPDFDVFRRWYKIVDNARWFKSADIKSTFGSTAEKVDDLFVFDIGGNKYRVIVSVRVKSKKAAWVYIKHVLTHKEYDKGDWKASFGCDLGSMLHPDETLVPL